MLQIIRNFTWRDVLFAVKTFTAAMIALYIAFRLNLSQPSWSVTTVFIVSQPLAGMVLAKSIYRVLGTVIGAVVTLVLVGMFANSRELFLLAMSLWFGASTFVAIYLRDAPQAYAAVLAGYSTAIIGLPAVLAPEAAFDIAVARCLEITIGIACGTLMHHVVFPQRAGDALRKALDATLPNMAQWATDALGGQESEEKGLRDRRTIIASVVSLDSLRTFAALDTPGIRAIDAVIRQFQGRLLSLLALLVSVYDRMALLRQRDPAAAAHLLPLLERAAKLISSTAHPTTPEQSRLKTTEESALIADINARLPQPAVLRAEPAAFLRRSILLRVRDVIQMWSEAVRVSTHISAGVKLPEGGSAPSLRPYRDVMFALIGGAISCVTVMTASTFWIATAWPHGWLAVTFAGIMCSVMAAQDNPASSVTIFLKMSFFAVIVAALYLFALLPTLSTFPALVVALAPLYIAYALFLTAPRAIPFVMPMIFITGAQLGLTNAMNYDFAEFLNNFVANVTGIGIGAMALTLLRPLSTEWAVQRLTLGIMVDLSRAAGSNQTEDRSAFESRMFDRINALLMRLDPMDAQQRAAMQGGLASLRVGMNILALRRNRLMLPADAAASVNAAIAALANHFARAARGRATGLQNPLPLLAAARDRVLPDEGNALQTFTAEALYSIETTLAQHPEFFGLSTPASLITMDVVPA